MRCVEAVGRRSPPHSLPRPDETALFHFFPLSIASLLFTLSLLSQTHFTSSFVTYQILTNYSLLPIHCSSTSKPIQRSARHNHQLAAPNRTRGLCAFHNRQRIRVPTFLARGDWSFALLPREWYADQFTTTTAIFEPASSATHHSPWLSASASKRLYERRHQIRHFTNHQQTPRKAENAGLRTYINLANQCLDQSTVPPSRRNTRKSWSRSILHLPGEERVS